MYKSSQIENCNSFHEDNTCSSKLATILFIRVEDISKEVVVHE